MKEVYLKLVLLSDTHTMHDKINVPAGDVLIHAGDMALDGRLSEVQDTLNWLNNQPHPYVVAIAGNHDFALERPRHRQDIDFGRVIYLENSSVNIKGKNFWGSPVTPWFYNWAFNVHRGAPIRRYWDEIPDAGLIDVLITHGPPLGILDQAHPGGDSRMVATDHLGCEELAERIKISQPLVHVFGHIHGSYGKFENSTTKFFNASVVNEAYRVVNDPWEVDI